jgi:hypothetical protein
MATYRTAGDGLGLGVGVVFVVGATVAADDGAGADGVPAARVEALQDTRTRGRRNRASLRIVRIDGA